MSKARAVIVIASPGDETLYFHQGIREVSKNFTIDILCLACSSNSNRGKELQSLMKELGIVVIFKNLFIAEDLLPLNIENYIFSFLQSKKYDLVISYSPQKNRDVKLYQLQCSFACDKISRILGINFGFFSESSLLNDSTKNCILNLNAAKLFSYLGYYLRLLFKSNITKHYFIFEFLRSVCYFLSFAFRSNCFEERLFQPKLFKRQSSLGTYSHIAHLTSLKCYLNSMEYYYFRKATHVLPA